MNTIAPPRPRRRHSSTGGSLAGARRLGAYTDERGERREIVCLSGAAGTTLVVDRISAGRADPRLLAHLGADEPVENARSICAMYLATHRGRRCRSLTVRDLELQFGEGDPPADRDHGLGGANGISSNGDLRDRHGSTYRLEPVPGLLSIPQLRWCRYAAQPQCRPQPISVREVLGALESYEPARTLTLCALERHERDPDISVALLRGEHERVSTSPIVLNRGLREAVRRALATGEVALSEIAIRCGRIRRGARGVISGETSWLARRIGEQPEAGHAEPTPWVHSDVLALIARDGLGLSPNQVEL